MKVGNIEFKEDERHTIEEAGNIIDEVGMTQLCYLIQRLLNKYKLKTLYLEEFEDMFDHRWIVPKGKFSGTFPKRTQSIFYKEFGVKLTPEEVQEIGNLARSYTQGDRQYIFDVTRQIGWRAGEFGDDDSCYWQTRSSAKQMIIASKGGAIRFFRPACSGRGWTYGEGLARCWILPYQEVWIIFNSYSDNVPYSVTLLNMARVFADYCGLSYRRAFRVTNNGAVDGQLWINGGIGYIIGEPDKIEQLKDQSIDFNIPHINPYCCDNCGYEMEYEEDGFYSPRGDYLCPDCAEDIYTTCRICREYVEYDDATRASDTGFYYCDYCTQVYLEFCSECNEAFQGESMRFIDIGALCSSCYTEVEKELASEQVAHSSLSE